VEIWVRALRDPEMAKEHEVLNRRWRRSIADIVRHGRETGEFPEGRDADELGIQIGAVIDGFAIQVLMDHGDVSPDDMFRVSREVSAKLIGFALEPAGA
ncbi:MAG: TetR family transcriptional regulator C-terminal domain-containing protein, partial [Actinomycetota bacterium]